MCTGLGRYQDESTDKTSVCTVRKKVWQLDSPFHCSVIGTCLSSEELRRLCRKLRIRVQADLTDYELHRSFVGIAGKKTYAFRCLHRYLDQKYRVAIHRFAKAQISEKDNTIRRLNDRLRQTEGAARALASARERLAALKNDPLPKRLRRQVEDLEGKLTSEQARAARAEANAESWKKMALQNGDRHLQLEGRLAALHAERDAVEATLAKLLAPDCSSCATQEGCLSDINLCGRCILYVGGRSRQCAQFRALVERQNGQFIHHDGGLHDGRLRLGSILPQADAVLCPLDCVSHDAANRVKQFCKRHGKRLVLLPRSSLAACTRGLNELVA